MRITEVESIAFTVPTDTRRTRWGYGERDGAECDTTTRILRIGTDEGAEGYAVGGYGAYFPAPEPAVVDALLKPLLLGEDPLNRERLWHWMTAHTGFAERMTSSVDMALWDLLGRLSGLPVYKLLGGYRDRVLAYCSTAPNLGGPEVYAKHALEAKERGYKAFKVHANIFWDPHKRGPAPGKPAFPKEDIEICRAVRAAVGDEMVLMHDPWGVYTLQESLWAGRELEKLGYYWLEQPMEERRMEAYVELTRALDIAILAPELEEGGPFTRSSWIRAGAADMGRMDVGLGGITATMKTVHLYEAFGQQCEIHVGGFGNLAVLGATTEETCEYYERGLTIPGVDRDATPPYLLAPCDPMDEEGYVQIPQGPGLGIELNWDYIDANRVEG